MAVFGHSGSHAPQLMHSLVITVAMHFCPFCSREGWRLPGTRNLVDPFRAGILLRSD
jgi:hypothetical protein